ncbi:MULTISPECIES: hypothetical protein [unclassified Roseibium]|uniref:hypothetical protein n=1 Tax=unclassified Roseibium TaxID=2629323 RepID=UPI00273F3649|nr:MULTISPECIES: hypothetical protein [unclassified Roseibium]
MPKLLYSHPCRDERGAFLGIAYVYPESSAPDCAEVLKQIPDAIIRKLSPDGVEVFVPASSRHAPKPLHGVPPLYQKEGGEA